MARADPRPARRDGAADHAVGIVAGGFRLCAIAMARDRRSPGQQRGEAAGERARFDQCLCDHVGFLLRQRSRAATLHEIESRGESEVDGAGSGRTLLALQARPQSTSSTAIAVASPPPMHKVATPRFRPWVSSAEMRVARSRAPLAPIGWPRAVAPPWTLSFSRGMPRSRMAIIATQAK